MLHLIRRPRGGPAGSAMASSLRRRAAAANPSPDLVVQYCLAGKQLSDPSTAPAAVGAIVLQNWQETQPRFRARLQTHAPMGSWVEIVFRGV